MKKNNNLKAFTILEAVVVLGITVIVLVFGIFGVISLRRSIELKNGYTDLVSNIKTIQNNAKNSIANSAGNAPKYYVISFANGQYSYETCEEDASFKLVCTVEQNNIKASRFNNVEINTTSTCTRLAFERLSPSIVSLSSTNTVRDTGVCTITLSQDSVSRTFNIVVDLEANTINYDSR